MDHRDDVIRALEERVKRLEDEQAVYRLVSSYGPAMDTGSGAECGALWADDGVYEFDGKRAHGPAGVAAMTEADYQQQLIREGCAHVMAMPLVEVDGDTAVATCYSRVYRHGDDGYWIWRVSANRWELVRTADGWRIKRRTNRTLDGGPEARDILRRAVGAELEEPPPA
jgi:ketosteroid isomerase-like protein